MLWHDGNMLTLYLICIALQVLMKKPTQRLFSMLLRQKKEEQLSLVTVYSPGTDVFTLLIRRYSQVPKEASFVTGCGTQQRRIQIKKIYDELGPAEAAALAGFHAFMSADITGSFAGEGKLQCWKIFNQADEDVKSVPF